jgi:hypothetical protein
MRLASASVVLAGERIEMNEEIRVPTRADHAREESSKLDRELASASQELRALAEKYRERIVNRRVDSRAQERASARIEYARKVCQAVGEARGLSAEAVAALALLGQGGPCNCGGTMGASQLPLLPQERIWRWRRHVGPAWCAALRGVAGQFRPILREEEGGVAILLEGEGWMATVGRITPDGVEGVIADDAEVKECVRRAINGLHEAVDGLRFTVIGSALALEIASVALAEQ